MKKFLMVLFFLSFLLVSCGINITRPLISYKPYKVALSQKPQDSKIDLYESDKAVTQSFQVLGELAFGDSGLSTRCSYGEIMANAQEYARKVGGDALIILEHKHPGLASTCHRMKFHVISYD